jgi:hypothetical protein
VSFKPALFSALKGDFSSDAEHPMKVDEGEGYFIDGGRFLKPSP